MDSKIRYKFEYDGYQYYTITSDYPKKWRDYEGYKCCKVRANSKDQLEDITRKEYLQALRKSSRNNNGEIVCKTFIYDKEQYGWTSKYDSTTYCTLTTYYKFINLEWVEISSDEYLTKQKFGTWSLGH